MKEIPILFSTPMVQAILAGRKTMTRRIVDIDDLKESPEKFRFVGDSLGRDFPRPAIKYDDRVWYEWQLINSNAASWAERCRWKKRDLVWVRETWAPDLAGNDLNDYIEYIKYEADGTRLPIKWVKDYDRYSNRPGIHMNKEYARIWLQVTGIHVERLQEITEEDAIAEGVEKRPGSDSSTRFDYKHYGYDTFDVDAKVSFRTLWEKINGVESWAANPWVWVVSFDVLSTTGKPK